MKSVINRVINIDDGFCYCNIPESHALQYSIKAAGSGNSTALELAIVLLVLAWLLSDSWCVSK
jgi:hypothetical protein